MHCVVRKFCQRKEFDPGVLLLVAEGSEVSFLGLVLALGLAVSLRVEGGRELVVEAHVGADSSPNMACELRSADGDDIVLYAMLADHILEKHTCHFR